MAVWEPTPKQEAAALETFRELGSIVEKKNYGRDLLYRDREAHYIFMRYWKSEEARRSALEDPEMQRCWARLGNQVQIIKVYETLTAVPLSDAAQSL